MLRFFTSLRLSKLPRIGFILLCLFVYGLTQTHHLVLAQSSQLGKSGKDGSKDDGKDDDDSDDSDGDDNSDDSDDDNSGSGSDNSDSSGSDNSGSGSDNDDDDSGGHDNSGSDNSGSGNSGNGGGSGNGNSGSGNSGGGNSGGGNHSNSGDDSDDNDNNDDDDNNDNSGHGNNNDKPKDAEEIQEDNSDRDNSGRDNSGKDEKDDRLYYVGTVSASDGSSLLADGAKLQSTSPWVEVLGTGMWFEAYGYWQGEDTFIADEVNVLSGDDWAYVRAPAVLLGQNEERQIEAWTRGNTIDTQREASQSVSKDSVRVVAYFDGVKVRALPQALTPPTPDLPAGWIEFTGHFDGDGIVWESLRQFP
jgi:hypothetical protein